MWLTNLENQSNSTMHSNNLIYFYYEYEFLVLVKQKYFNSTEFFDTFII